MDRKRETIILVICLGAIITLGVFIRKSEDACSHKQRTIDSLKVELNKLKS